MSVAMQTSNGTGEHILPRIIIGDSELFDRESQKTQSEVDSVILAISKQKQHYTPSH